MKISAIKNLNIPNFIKMMPSARQNPALFNAESDTFERRNTNPSFEGKSCSTVNFEIKRLYDIKCPCCGSEMLNSENLDKCAKNIQNKRGQDLVNSLKLYEKYYRPTEKEVALELMEGASDMPSLSLSELTKILSQIHKERLVKEQMVTLSEIKGMAEGIGYEKDKKTFMDYIEYAIAKAQDFDDDNPFKRKAFIRDIETIGSNFKNPKDRKLAIKMKMMAEKLPTSVENKDAFFIKYSRRKNGEIAKRLLAPSIATTEHIKPRSLGGSDNTSNYMTMCAKCNSDRSSIPYNMFFVTHPEMPKNMQVYLDDVVDRINKGELTGACYFDYPDEFQEAIKEATEGRVVLDVPEIKIERQKPNNTKPPKTLEEQIGDLSKSCEDKKDKINKLTQKKSALSTDKTYLILVKRTELKQEIENLKMSLKQAKEKLNQARKTKEVNERRLKRKHDLQALYDTEENPTNKKEIMYKIKKIDTIDSKIPDKEIEKSKKSINEINLKIKEKEDELLNFETENAQYLPEYYKERYIELSKLSQKIFEIKSAIVNRKQDIGKKGEILKQKTKLEEDIKALKMDIVCMEDSVPLDLAENKAKVHEYELLKKKQGVLEDFDVSKYFSQLKLPQGIRPKFIIDEAKESIRQKIDNLSKTDAVALKIKIEKLDGMINRRENFKIELDRISRLELDVENLKEELENIKGGKTEQQIQEELDMVRTKLEVTEDKQSYLDIDDKISYLKQSLEENIEEMEALRAKRSINEN